MRRLVLILLLSNLAHAQYPWSGILNPSRAVDWSTAGIPGGIPNVTTQCGNTLQPSGGDDTSNILAAFTLCSTTTDSYIQLAAGTFNTSGSLSIPSHVVLRGMGADQTIIRMSVTSATTNLWGFVLGGGGQSAFSRVFAISSSPSKGDTQITAALIPPANLGTPATSLTSLAAGQLVWIAPLNDWFPACAGFPNTVPSTSHCINTSSDIELSTPGGAAGDNMDGAFSAHDWSQRAAGQMNMIVSVNTTTGVMTLQDPLVDSFRHPLQDWVANSPANPITGFNRGMAIRPTSQTAPVPHVYVQTAATWGTAGGYCLTGPNPPAWPTNGTTVTESVPGLVSPQVACVWEDMGPGTDSIPHLMYWVPGVHTGIENLQIYGVNSLDYGPFQSLIHIFNCAYCWIRGIEINRTIGFIIRAESSYHGEIENNYFTTAWYHGSGTDSVIEIGSGTSAFLVQNNIFERTPGALFTDNGSSGNVIAYNYALGTWGGNSLNSAGANLISHDAFPWFNLSEGNIVNGVGEDGIHGGNGLGTRFRNWNRGTTKICQPVSGTGLTGGTPTRPPASLMTVTTNAPGATSYSYAYEIVIGGAQSVPSTAVTISNGPATLSASTYNTVHLPNIPNPYTMWQGGQFPSTTPPPNATTDMCLVFRCSTAGCTGTGNVGTQIGRLACSSAATIQDTGQASTGINMGGTGEGASMVPGTPAICTPVANNNTTANANAWLAYNGVWPHSYGQYSRAFNNVGTITGSQDLSAVALINNYSERRKACAICSATCQNNNVACPNPTASINTCTTVVCGGATARNYSWPLDESYGFGTGTVCNPATTVCHDTTLAQDTVFHCLNYFHSMVNDPGGPVEAGDCPSNTVLPPSFYLSAKPAWWGNAHWPPIGPDVSGGLANSFGYAYNNPAKNCYENVMGGTDSTGAPLLTFNAAACYSAAAPPPVITAFSVAPSSIQSGGSATLSWTVSDATTVSIDQGIGSVAASGSQSVSPSTTTTYTLTAINANGSNLATAVLTVSAPPATGPSRITGHGQITGNGKIT